MHFWKLEHTAYDNNQDTLNVCGKFRSRGQLQRFESLFRLSTVVLSVTEVSCCHAIITATNERASFISEHVIPYTDRTHVGTYIS